MNMQAYSPPKKIINSNTALIIYFILIFLYPFVIPYQLALNTYAQQPAEDYTLSSSSNTYLSIYTIHLYNISFIGNPEIGNITGYRY